jgi:DNA-binding NarL/FixJ family response regulator
MGLLAPATVGEITGVSPHIRTAGARPKGASAPAYGAARPRMQSAAVHLGAMGLIWKDSQPAELWNAIEKVYMGAVWLGRVLIADVLSTMTCRDEPQVTAREQEVIGLAGEGLKNQVIAQRLYISEATVRHHITSIFAKLGVADRFELALYAYRHGLAQLPCSVPTRN